jgi:multidrug resistance efflux pump
MRRAPSLASLEQGGRPAELTEIDNSLARARFELEKEQKDYEALQRLQEQEAATAHEVQEAADKVRQSQIEIEGWKSGARRWWARPMWMPRGRGWPMRKPR